MKNLFVIAFLAGALVFPTAVSAQCAKCAQAAAATAAKPAEAPSVQPIPGTNESMPVGRIENLTPIAVITVLGCEKCAEEAVNWALKQGSSPDDVDRVLKTVAAMQKLDCFKAQFGPDTATRMEKPLAAARRVLDDAAARAAAR